MLSSKAVVLPTPDLVLHSDPAKRIMIDSATGSKWTFRGCAVSGPATGQCLRPIPALKDYWFDWRIDHPDSTVHNK